METLPISTIIVISSAVNVASLFELEGKSIETERTTWSEFLNREKYFVEKMPASEEVNKSKRIGLWVSHTGIRLRNLTSG